MKISYEVLLKTPAEPLWKIIADFSKYPEWNPVITSIEGPAEFEAKVKAVLKLSGSPPRHAEALVTGFAPPRYFSFETSHRFGAWFYREEWILRMKEGEQGTAVIAEAYVTGLSLRFRRSAVEGAFRRTLVNWVDAIHDRA